MFCTWEGDRWRSEVDFSKFSDTDALREEVRKEYFITSAAITPEDAEYARQNDIGVMDGEDLMDLLVSQLGALSETTRRQLGVLPIPYCV